MNPRERFVFGIPLIARASSRDWDRVEQLFALTLGAVLGQCDGDFLAIVVGHDEPACWRTMTAGDPRFRFVCAPWPPQKPNLANDDGGRKKWLIRNMVRRTGGGLLMYLDADDLVDARLVESARSATCRRHVGAVVEEGFAIDFPTMRALPLPHPEVFEGGFHQLCGSSTVGRIEPASPEPVRRDPHEALGSHHRWPEAAKEAGVALARLPVVGGYLVNTAENHSELHGEFTQWRRAFNEGVADKGVPIGPALASRLGLSRGP